MAVYIRINTSTYRDSIALMLAAKELIKNPFVEDAAVVMGTEANKNILRQNNLYSPLVDTATSNDLIIAVRSSVNADDIFSEAEKILQKKPAGIDNSQSYRPRTIRSAIKSQPESNLAVISIAGRYAAAEAWEALHYGLHVLLFSDNVSLEDEIALKKYAVQHSLLLMGPGAGTAILNGVGIGFANALPRGPVGIVSAAGTGLQEVSTLLAKLGVGITQGIGTGGRDLKKEVGGIMMLAGLQALQQDANTKVIVLVSKPPDKQVSKKVIKQIALSTKPTVICFLGSDEVPVTSENIHFVSTLEQAALIAARLGSAEHKDKKGSFHGLEEDSFKDVTQLRQGLLPKQKFLCGLFSGGTLCYEAQVIWRNLLKEPVFSNAPLEEVNRLADPNYCQGNSAIDLGEEEFTVGRPHPMIDNDLRIRRMQLETQNPEVAVIMLDVVIGYGSHPDPASELGPAAQRAIQTAEKAGRKLLFITSVTGTEQDPQCLSRTTQTLRSNRIIVCNSNASAARLTASIISGKDYL